MDCWKSRTALLLGDDVLSRLAEARVVVVGVGGVGAFAAEMLSRAGVGHIVLIDSDVVEESNLNRQLVALRSTLGLPKVDVLRDRILDINPAADVSAIRDFVTPENIGDLIGASEDTLPTCVVDAIDTVAPKVALIEWCVSRGIRIVSAMGAGAKCDVTKIRIADISDTFNCTLAAVVRRRLRKDGIFKGVRVVFSEELPCRSAVIEVSEQNKNSTTGTVSYLTAAFGCALAQAVLEYYR